MRSDNALKISFRHQTLFEFFRARGFLRDGQSLAEFVVDEKHQSLFVRPTLWSTLNYLRGSDKASYRDQFGALWNREDLRAHVRHLLVNFLGQLPDPDDQEARLMFARLDAGPTGSRTLLAMRGSPGWFARLSSRLPSLMTRDPREVDEVSVLLRLAASFEPGAVLSAVNRHWVQDDRYLQSALSVLREINAWDEPGVETVCTLVDHAPEDMLWISHLVEKISESRPDLAPKIVSRYLWARTRRSNPDEAGQLIESDSEWYGVDKVARRAPRVFVGEIWPWLVELFTRLGQEEEPFLQKYRDHHSLAFNHHGMVNRPLQEAIALAIRIFAEEETDEFLNFLENHKDTDLRVLHRLLSEGLRAVAERRPQAVLRYLLEDSRRFALGDFNNEHAETATLISAVVPFLEEGEKKQLEDRIRVWNWYRGDNRSDHAVDRRWKQRWNREHRLTLLCAFPFERLSSEGQQTLGKEERVLPGTSTKDESPTLIEVKSPMSCEQMEKATDDQILGLFEELTDDTGSTHPTRAWTSYEGGSEQASQELAKFAKRAPDRALNLVRKFTPGKTERTAGAVLEAIAKDFKPPLDLVVCIHELHGRGFFSESFRIDAARCLREVARRKGGLDDASCRMLESWLTNSNSERDSTPGDVTPDSVVSLRGAGWPERETQKSVLWNRQGTRILPHGNYPFLDALMVGHLLREPPEVDGCLDILERHLKRRENPVVWREVAEHLGFLSNADRKRATAFLESLFSSVPEVLNSDTGVLLVAKVMEWTPTQLLDQVIESWISGGWRDGPQAAGEVLALKFCRNPEDEEAQGWIERILSGAFDDRSIADGLRLGVTYTFAKAWAEPALRALTTPRLVKLAASGCVKTEKALSGIFGHVDSLPADEYTRAVLEALLERPATLTQGAYFLVQGLKGLLCDGWNSGLVHRIVSTLVSEWARDLGDVRSAAALDAGEIADIALTLHRIPETKEIGLDLFERLLEVGSYGLDERLNAIDKRAFK